MTIAQSTSLHDRLIAAIEVVLDDPGLDPKLKALQKLVMPMVRTYIQKTDAESLRKGLIQFRDEVLPFLLGEVPQGGEHDASPNQE